jgi:hypothetical protein
LPTHDESARQVIRIIRLPGAESAMNRLITLTALIETAAGLALIIVPSVVVRLLLGAEISGAGIPLGRVAGFGLLSLGIAYWPNRDFTCKITPAVWAMLTYNSLTTLYLLCLGIGGEFIGPLLWPAMVLHGNLSLLLARQWWLGNTGFEPSTR